MSGAQRYTDDDLKRAAGIVEEAYDDRLRAINEGISSMRDQINNLPTREEFDELKSDMKVVKAAVTANSNQLSDHESRITRLEANA